MNFEKEIELKLQLIDGSFSIHKLSPKMAIPATVLESEVFFVAQTKDELSIVCSSEIGMRHAKTEPDWACFMVVGPLDFTLTGILARISNALSQARISIFAISTFDTDYILVKESDLERAQKVLKDSGYHV